MKNIICEHCKCTFTTRHIHQRFCSESCVHKFRTGKPRGPTKRWSTCNTWYRYIKVGGKLRQEHRVVMEQILGRKLEPDEHVHHKNGNKRDNRPENLELTNVYDHPKLHWEVPCGYSPVPRTDTTQRCCQCKNMKLFADFNKNQRICRDCQKAYYRANKHRFINGHYVKGLPPN